MVGADIFHVDIQTDQHDTANSCLHNFLANAPEKRTPRMNTEEYKYV
jgi:hypothetical protein